MERIKVSGCTLLLVATLAAGAAGQSQPAGAGISGTVTDKGGAVVTGALVTITGSGGLTKTTASDNQGDYSLALPPGTYDVSVKAEGFEVFKRANVTVAEGQNVKVDTILTLAAAKTSINVEGSKTAKVETESAEVSGTITQKEIVSLGLNGRNFTQLIALTPGVSNQTGQDEATVGVTGSVKYSVNGGRVEYNTFDVDGADLLNVGINGDKSTLIVYPSLDAIEEVKVLTSNYGAMYGRSASGTVLVRTKSGGGQFHGNAYEFLRNENFNARNFFDQTHGAPLYRRNDFGFTLGGPLFIPGFYNTKKDKTFFFFSEELRREKTPIEFNQAVPSLAERQGDFSDVCPAPGSKGYPDFLRSQYPDCPTNGPDASNFPYLTVFPSNQLNGPGSIVSLDRNALAILGTGIIPPPNSASGCNSTTGSCYATTVSPPTSWREELLRIDHNFSAQLLSTLRLIHDAWDTTVPTPQWGLIQNSFPTIQNRFLGPGTSAVARVTYTASPTLLNEFVFGYADSHITLMDMNGPGAQWQRPGALDAPCAPDATVAYSMQCPIGYLFNNGYGGKMPGIVIAGNNREYGGYGFAVDSGYMPWDHTNPTFGFDDNILKVAGKHTLQLGAQFTIYQRNQVNAAIGAATGDVQGILTFSNVESISTTGNAFADFLYHLGDTTGAIQSFQQDSAQAKYYQRYQIAEPYFQDDWRISSRFTVNLGVRVSLFGNYREKNHNAYNWEPGAFSQSLASNVTVDPFSGVLLDTASYSPIPLDLSNLDPRITNGLVRCGVKGVPAGCMKGHLFNPAPRLGFAWDPRGDGTTSVRLGYGVFFEHGAGNEANTGSLEGSSPLVLDMTQTFPSGWSCIGGVGPECGANGAYPLSVTAIPTKAVWPYVQQWSLSVQRELPKGLLATLAYVGSKGTHLTAERQLNQLTPTPAAQNPFGPQEPLIPAVDLFDGDCTGFTGNFNLLNGTIISPGQPAFVNLEAACFGAPLTVLGEFPDVNALRQFAPGFNRILSLENIANSSYNALQATLRRVEGPLTLGISYTYGHSIDDSSDRSDTTFVNSFDLHSTRASSNFDERHLLNISYLYNLPLIGLGKRINSFFGAGADQDVNATEGSPSLPEIVFRNWTLSGITVFQSGTPFSVINDAGANGISALDNAGVANGAGAGSFPDRAVGPHPKPTGRNFPLTFGPLLGNPAAFVAPRGLTFGNAGRNVLTNPHRTNFDVAFLRNLKVKESDNLELRLEAFNIFNHTQFRIYDPNLGNTGSNTIGCYGGSGADYSAAGGDGVDCLTGSSFLHPVDAHRPRTVQLGAKFTF
jgi:hypothetical protein